MLYYLFDWLDRAFDFPGAGVFQYISFRASMAAILSLLIMLFCGKPFIRFIRRKSIGETVRNLGLEGQKEKEGTPTMGGLIILSAIVIPTLLLAKLDNVYVITMLVTTLWLGLIGFIDDYIKVFKKDKAGMPGKFKVFGQIVLGLGVGLLLSFHPDIASTKTTIPFVKGNEFDYAWLISWMGDWTQHWVWVVYVLVAIFVVTAVSNAANLTDGIDGLATSTASIIGGALAILAWLSGNIIMANYLNIVYLHWASCGSTPILPRYSWATPARWLSAASSPSLHSLSARNLYSPSSVASMWLRTSRSSCRHGAASSTVASITCLPTRLCPSTNAPS